MIVGEELCLVDDVNEAEAMEALAGLKKMLSHM